ncbi:MAG: hypothetical protein R2765_03400 [Ferruginibacter sp.]
MYDAGAPDQGTLTNWSIDITYVEGATITNNNLDSDCRLVQRC